MDRDDDELEQQHYYVDLDDLHIHDDGTVHLDNDEHLHHFHLVNDDNDEHDNDLDDYFDDEQRPSDDR